MYEVRGYFDADMRGLSESKIVKDHTQMVDTVHEYCSNADYVHVENIITGTVIDINPDSWMESIEFGDVPECIKAFA